MKTVLLCCLILCFGTMALAQNGFVNKTIEILPDSHLTITGDTNINSFTCDFNTVRLERTQNIEFNEQNGRIKFKNAILSLNKQGFDCGSRGINKDFHDLIKSEKYPAITLELNEINTRNPQKANAHITIKMAGKTKDYTVPVEISNSPTPCYTGVLKLNINDFDLEPPKKMFGLIVVRDDIDVTFNLAVKK